MSTRVKRRALSLDCKVQMIKAIESGIRHGDVCRKFDVKPSTLSTILKKKTDVLKMFEHNKIEPCRKRMRFSAVDDVEQALLKWFTSARSMNVPISGPILQAKAEDLGQRMNHSEFKASNGWLERFKSRHGITFKSVCGEAASVSDDMVDDWVMLTLPGLIDGYAPRDIFNADETGLFFRLMPNKTLSFKNDVCSGGKTSKERLTVMLCANMDGSEKLKPLVIGKSKNPRCFKNVKSLPVDYKANKKAWMVSDLFIEWLHKLDKKYKRQKRKILMFVDNCPAHPAVKNLKAIKLVFLPPNTTSKLQPMDQGVIRNFKCFYRQRVVQRMLVNLDSGETLPTINVKDAIDMLHSSWQKVTDTTIANCFRKASFVHSPNPDVEQEVSIADRGDIMADNTSDVECLWGNLAHHIELPEISFSDFVCADDETGVCESPSDDAIIASILEQNAEADEDDIENVSPDIPVDIELPSSSEAMDCIVKLRTYLQSRENVETMIFSQLSTIEDMLFTSICSGRRQTKITDFLK
uniref:Tigger transposable element-derived protein 6-like n=1 Tax=Saccoglossus kowalevskii TaxID=10224 RepID=A0ABM0GQM9_SACKO|nr:PREDICTED: tigger transposable element-derived protein 6-like [Saccoglossus kowalevskii]